MRNDEFLKSGEMGGISPDDASDAVSDTIEIDEQTETIDYGGDFEDPTATMENLQNDDVSDPENSADIKGVFPDGASDATIQGVHDPAIVEKILEMDAMGLSGRKIAEEMGGEELSKDDIFAVLRHFKVWTAWKCPDTENRVGRAVGQTGDPEDGEKVTEMMQKIRELTEKNDRILTEKVALERELKQTNENTAGLRKWVDRFKPQLDDQVLKLTEELNVTQQKNKELKEAVERAETGGPWITRAWDYQDGYQRGKEHGREEMKLENEAQGTSWSTWLLLPFTGVAGIVAGAVVVWVLK